MPKSQHTRRAESALAKHPAALLPGERPRFPVPADFPNHDGPREVAIVDTLIEVLFLARRDLTDPPDEPRGRYGSLWRVEQARRALIPFGDAPYTKAARRALLVQLLDDIDQVTRHGGDVLNWLMGARIMIGEALPYSRPPADDVLRRAFALWPNHKQRAARSAAIEELARALGCDAKSLPVMIRQDRKKRRDQLKALKKGTT